METYQRVPLSKVTAIRSGHPFRHKVQDTPEAWDYCVLQLKDVQKDRILDLGQADRVKMTDGPLPHPLKRGDVLLRARGGYYYAALFDSDAPNVVATGQFFVLTPDPKRLEPSYLTWYVNETQAQRYLDKNQSGSNIPMIGKRTVSDLPIPLPPLEVQRKIAAIHQCWLEEKQITEQLLGNRERMVRGICQKFISGQTMINGNRQ